jgi:hypothetical protein
MTDHGSGEGSRIPLEKAVELLTGAPPLSVDARHFMTDGGGRVGLDRNGFKMEVASEGFVVSPEVLIVYEIPPADRGRLVAFQRQLLPEGPLSFGADPDAWRNATDKRRTVDCFRRDGIPHMETIALCRPDLDTALGAFERLGGDVWARPTIGAGGTDVFHLTTRRHLRAALRHYAASDQDCLLSRDARNVTKDGRRHQFRVIVLHERVLRVCEHMQPDPDAPCNESRGAVSTVIPTEDLPLQYHRRDRWPCPSAASISPPRTAAWSSRSTSIRRSTYREDWSRSRSRSCRLIFDNHVPRHKPIGDDKLLMVAPPCSTRRLG